MLKVMRALTRLSIGGILLVPAFAAAAQRRGDLDTTFRLVRCQPPRVDAIVDCGTYMALENRDRPGGRRIPLYVMVLRARNPKPQSDPIFVLEGGPGLTATAGALFWSRWEARADRDVVLADVRGTSAGFRLDCDLPGTAEQPQNYLSTMFPLKEFRACRNALHRKADLSRYTAWDAADDFEEIRRALGYDKINLVGSSAGTRQALVILRRYPRTVRSALLDGVAPPGIPAFLEHARSAQDGLDSLIAECSRQRPCASAYPALRADLDQVRLRFKTGIVRVPLPDSTKGDVRMVDLTWPMFAEALRVLTYYSRYVPQVPSLLHRAAAGDFGPFVEIGIQSNRALRQQVRFAVNVSMACSEDAPLVRSGDVERRTHGTYLGDTRAREELAVCREWPASKAPADFLDTAPVDIPVLMFSGSADPASPPRYAAQAARSLPNALHVVFKGSHGQRSPCADSIRGEFLRLGSVRGLRTDCALTVAFPQFATPSPVRMSALIDSVGRAFTASDTLRAIAFLREALALSPSNPILLDGMLRMRARTRDSLGVLGTLARLALTGGGRPVTSDALYTFIAGYAPFDKMARAHDSTLAPRRLADTAMVLPDSVAMEGIAIDPNDPGGLVVYGSRSGKVIRMSARNPTVAETVVTLDAGILGMKVDGQRRLWVTANPRSADSVQKTSRIVVIDLLTDRILREYTTPSDGQRHQLNDLAISPDGTVFISDTQGHRVYRLQSQGRGQLPREMEAFFEGDPRFDMPNGVAVTEDGSRLYVAHFDGILSWNLHTGKHTAVASPLQFSLVSIDGLYSCQASLIGVQTLPGAGRVMRLHMDSSGTVVTNGEILDRARASSRGMSTGSAAHGFFYFIARPPQGQPGSSRIMRVPLADKCVA